MTPAPFHAEIADAPPPERVVWAQADDDTRIRLALWPAGPRGMVAIFPGRTEVIEKYGRIVTDLAGRGYGAAVIDWRGQGLSDRLRDTPLLGDVPDFADFQRDVAVFRQFLDLHAPDAQRFVLAHSMGGCIALRALVNGFPARAVSFSAPMWGLPLSNTLRWMIAVSRPTLGLTKLVLREVPGAGIEFRLWENSFDNNDLTSDRATYEWMQRQVQAHPELRLGAPSLRWLMAALAETTALAGSPSPAMAAYCGLGTRERVVSDDAIHARMATWPQGQLDMFDGALHELMMERPAARGRFLDQTCATFDAAQP
ncbi:alpha/beta fold hydrolase [Roseinatronobacter alkalisoli]|uniref:Alpha/beta hydrolase n=1 Tax=Roseinatronobacter alkalisoli TaxID=3028235 RepID=A0ABT5T310_9RHOB|nr:alpha/beta hydrolase [Roseinatronobacter sp. HJB301]MDD7969508.1 alpha/beta hydrolase [Roseinatronobacter sp. HJB301]